MYSGITKYLLIVAAGALTIPMACAQDAANTTTTTKSPGINQRRENQQDRIGEGVENGSLTAGEAAHIEKQESNLNKEIHTMKSDGNFTAAERAKVTRQQNRLSNEIYNQKHDSQAQHYGNSEVGKREANQQQRIGEGIENGSLTAREASTLERREAGINKEVNGMREANGGHLTAGERKLVNHQENRASRAIYRKKHNARGQ